MGGQDKQEKSRAYYAANKERIAASRKAKREADPEKYREQCRRWRINNREAVLKREAVKRALNREKYNAKSKAWLVAHPEYFRENRDRIRENQRKWRKKNAERVRATRREWFGVPGNREKYNAKFRRLRATDPNYKIASNLRARITAFVRSGPDRLSAVKLLGCSVPQLRAHLEAQFLPGMSWENYGRTGWHIDHVVPLSILDLSDPCEFSRGSHYTNLQPLWGHVNLSKGNRSAPAQ